ncbi:hypothetical protein GDI3157 [Gluconacetobacter diazotrophicus PA1 5]|uniref:Uncharacterized protein n=1 Tax=Gluconacetobacter diazotrophicus (strain ATCC 49037 / DSM 5601 / CCUG 37298 / CIP 103539 / LMG 7603 / PAl5) TaxID=272568 RepID=A9H0B0_GLUDA|nr:hypothetical protein GDI3157 [Gluconacetobacter diazotrophicus PA1 5]
MTGPHPARQHSNATGKTDNGRRRHRHTGQRNSQAGVRGPPRRQGRRQPGSLDGPEGRTPDRGQGRACTIQSPAGQSAAGPGTLHLAPPDGPDRAHRPL